MKDTFIVILLVAVAVVALLVWASLLAPKVTETDEYIWIERGQTVIPGFVLGIPAGIVEFQAVKVRRADVVLKRDFDFLGFLPELLRNKKDTVLFLEVEDSAQKFGAVVLAIDRRLEGYVDKITSFLGLGEDSSPDEKTQEGNYIVLIFYGRAE